MVPTTKEHYFLPGPDPCSITQSPPCLGNFEKSHVNVDHLQLVNVVFSAEH